MTDLVLINPGSRKAVFQDLGLEAAAIEPPFWIAVIAAYLREKGFSVAVIDANAENLSPEETGRTDCENESECGSGDCVWIPAVGINAEYAVGGGHLPCAEESRCAKCGARRAASVCGRDSFVSGSGVCGIQLRSGVSGDAGTDIWPTGSGVRAKSEHNSSATDPFSEA